MSTKFDGLIAFTITPTDSQLNFDPKAFRVLIDRLINAGADGVGILASSGAGVYFTSRSASDSFRGSRNCKRASP